MIDKIILASQSKVRKEILNSNNIYVIDKGKIIDNGSHEVLMTKSDLYKNFYEKQIQK